MSMSAGQTKSWDEFKITFATVDNIRSFTYRPAEKLSTILTTELRETGF